MRHRLLHSITPLVLMLLLGACGASAPDQAENPNALPVVFVRSNERASTGEVQCDGKSVAQLAPETFFAMEVTPGEHAFSFWHGSASKLLCERGKRYFFNAWSSGLNDESHSDFSTSINYYKPVPEFAPGLSATPYTLKTKVPFISEPKEQKMPMVSLK